MKIKVISNIYAAIDNSIYFNGVYRECRDNLHGKVDELVWHAPYWGVPLSLTCADAGLLWEEV